MRKNHINKILVLGIVVLFIGIGIYPSSAMTVEEKPIVPMFRGGTLYVGGDGPGNYSKIQDAINDSVDGDTVYVYHDSSPYYEQINVSKSINLIGEDKNTTTIYGDWFSTVLISADNVTLSKFTIINSRKEEGMYQCINVISDNNVISNNNVNSKKIWYRQGIRLDKANNNEISGNFISNNYHGMSIVKSINTTISDNNVNLNSIVGIGIYYDNRLGYSNTKIFRNSISNSESGIYFFDCENGYISDNIISNNDEGILFDRSKNTEILSNNIFSNKNNGIYLNSRSDKNIISSNIITSNNHDGIKINGSSNNKINGNKIASNKYNGIDLGFYVYGETREYSRKNKIIKNNFIDNKNNAFFEGSWKNTWSQNYWDRPRILPKLIFGEINLELLHFQWFNIDWHPAIKPYDI